MTETHRPEHENEVPAEAERFTSKQLPQRPTCSTRISAGQDRKNHTARRYAVPPTGVTQTLRPRRRGLRSTPATWGSATTATDTISSTFNTTPMPAKKDT